MTNEETAPGHCRHEGTEQMLEREPDDVPGAPGIAADLRALPFRRNSLDGAWADRSYLHMPAGDMPLALWDLHRVLVPGAPVFLRRFGVPHGAEPTSTAENQPMSPGSAWTDQLLADVVAGAGFETISVVRTQRAHEAVDSIALSLRRSRTLADTVGPGMKMLLVGLNPSLAAADAGVGFVTATNRGWPALLAAGLATVDRDPLDLLLRHRIGMTDLVKRATARAGELTRAEYRDGVRRLDRLCRWLQPGVVVVLGVTGWRAATGEPTRHGVQPTTLGGRPVYVMANPSGANAHATLEDLVDHLRAAARLASDSHRPR